MTAFPIWVQIQIEERQINADHDSWLYLLNRILPFFFITVQLDFGKIFANNCQICH
jgi:hypothetical protein